MHLALPINDPVSHPAIAVEHQSQVNYLRSTREPDNYSDVGSRLAGLLSNHLHCSDNNIKDFTSAKALGMDSLMCMELRSDVEVIFGITVDLAPLMQASTFGELVNVVVNAISLKSLVPETTETITLTSCSPSSQLSPKVGESGHKNLSCTLPTVNRDCDFSLATRNFDIVSSDFEKLASEYGFAGFYDRVYEKNSGLVLAYTIEAFADLGVDLDTLSPGDSIPSVTVDPRHHHLRDVLYQILKHGGIANYNGRSYVRTSLPIATIPSSVLFKQIVTEFPQHAKEHMLLNLCGSELGKLMAGIKDPLVLLFGSTTNRAILEDVYSTSPMYLTMSQLLTRFLEVTLTTATPGSQNAFHIIEIGAGTGSTTKWVVDRLLQLGIPIEYTFTDISTSLVSAGKRKFSKYSCMKYATVDVEKEPLPQYLGQFDIVLATNCVHATRDLSHSLKNIYKLLRPTGFVCLVEFTSRMFWFDLVFGLLEGWWRFDDGRSYVLADPERWEKCMKNAGFSQVGWTGGSSRESEVVRVITAFKQPVEDSQNPSQ
ncbi:hypothetical protein E0Z10_g6256 [Xylaria hypoxylon]|uniref:Carrier domain-containing protein n=1 Tax=Xylaria hypoxylon TaxID=37992 RepID=A0A4Z0YR71_9PEZI|nr:hypothetical protein E0Z10_g6256 [Xylaria hypoxylon]